VGSTPPWAGVTPAPRSKDKKRCGTSSLLELIKQKGWLVFASFFLISFFPAHHPVRKLLESKDLREAMLFSFCHSRACELQDCVLLRFTLLPNSLARCRERVRVRDLCVARMFGAPHILSREELGKVPHRPLEDERRPCVCDTSRHRERQNFRKGNALRDW
jgi:hypothetical protein